MSLGIIPIGLVAVLLLSQSPSHPSKTDSQPESAAAPQSSSLQVQKPKPATPVSADPEKASSEYRLGMSFIGLGRLDDALEHCAAAMVLNTTDPAPIKCYRRAQETIQEERRNAVYRGVELVRTLTDQGAYAAAQNELNTLKSNESQATAKYGPNEWAAEEIDDSTARLARAQQRQWPAILPSYAGLAEWLPGVVSLIGRIITFCLIGSMLYLAARFARFVVRHLYWLGVSDVKRPIVWSVSSIADSTNQSAAGALIDALNVYYNPLFQKLYTSSFLAAPPSLIPADFVGDPSTFMWRNFLTDVLGLPSDLVRPYISKLIENIDTRRFARHRFRQVTAYENINLKLGFLDASLGAIANTIWSWWKKGWPSVTGSVWYEEINDQDFASVRLTCNFGISRNDREVRVAPNNVDIDRSPDTMKIFFSEERTLSVYASTQVDESTDAIALATQRAAFRLLYRLTKRPADPGLAIAASSYRQGVRMLNTGL
jgi:hypothetical protein